jgi:hypothetical protein
MTENNTGAGAAPETQTPQPEAPKTEAEAKAEAEKKAENERDKGKEKVTGDTKNQLEGMTKGIEGMLGGDFGLLMKQLFETFGKFLSSFDGIKDKMGNIFQAQTPEEIQKIMDESKKYKVPKIQNVDAITTTIENPQPDEKLVNYLYRCLKIPVPTAEQLDPEKTLDIRHLMFQMMGSFQFEKGESNIVKGLTEKPEKFFQGDLIFFRNKINGEITAGFVKSISKDTIEIETTDETGTQCIISKDKNMCLIAFHIPGNKLKGPVVKNYEEGEEKAAKEDPKKEQPTEQAQADEKVDR